MQIENQITTSFYGDDVRIRALSGMESVRIPVSVTHGAAGRRVLIEQNGGIGEPFITKDGVTVATHIIPFGRVEGMGAAMLKEAARQVYGKAGDGTTTVTVLGHELAKSAMNYVTSNKDANTTLIARGMEKAMHDVVSQLKSGAKDHTDELLRAVAHTSANGDETIADPITDIFLKLGETGSVSMMPNQGGETDWEWLDGYSVRDGVENVGILGDTNTLELGVDNPINVFVTNHSINSISDFGVKEARDIFADKAQGGVVIFGRQFGTNFINDTYKAMQYNPQHMRPLFIYLVEVKNDHPSQTDAVLSDIAAITGARYVRSITDSTDGYKLDDITADDFGVAGKISLNRERTQIISPFEERQCSSKNEDVPEGVDWTKEDGLYYWTNPALKPLEDHIKSVKGQWDNAIEMENKVAEKFHKNRYNKLTNGVAVLNVGARSKPELIERIARADDCIKAVRCAVREGIVLGGGLALLNCKSRLYDAENDYTEDEIAGMRLVYEMLDKPMQQIINNSGMDGLRLTQQRQGTYRPSLYNRLRGIFSSEYRELHKANVDVDDQFGYDVLNYEWVDFWERGIVDPYTVTASSVEAAVSIVKTLMTVGVGIVNYAPEIDGEN